MSLLYFCDLLNVITDVRFIDIEKSSDKYLETFVKILSDTNWRRNVKAIVTFKIQNKSLKSRLQNLIALGQTISPEYKKTTA